jgi:hypothetical protein
MDVLWRLIILNNRPSALSIRPIGKTAGTITLFASQGEGIIGLIEGLIQVQ